MADHIKTTDLHARVYAVLDRNAALGRNIRVEARALLLRAQAPADRHGYVRVCKVDFEALAAALDAEDQAFAHLSGAPHAE